MGFLDPAALLFSALGGVLIALALWERRRPTVDVPSLLFWQQVPEDRVRATRWRPDLLLLLQLLLLGAVVGGLARPYLGGAASTDTAVRHVFVLDVSASMQAREADGTRFDLARRALRRRIATLSAQDEIMLMTAAERARVVTPFSRDRAALSAGLDALAPLDTGTNLDSALAVADGVATATDPPAAVELFTDLPASHLDPQWRDRVAVSRVGASDANLAIEQIDVVQDRYQDPRDARVAVSVRNFSRREAHGLLTIDLEGRILARHGFSLPPRGTRTFAAGDLPGPGLLHARLDVDDALAVDNDAYGWVRPNRPLRVLVVSDSPILRAELESVGRTTPNLHFRFLPPADYTPGVADTVDVTLLHHFAPQPEPRGPALYLFPPPGNRTFPARRLSGERPLLDWNDRHPALRALRTVAPRPLGPVARIETPPWADVLLASRDGENDLPLAFAGEHLGLRRACVAFDVPAEGLLGADNVDLLLLVLGLLDWLAPPDTAAVIARTGDTYTDPEPPPGPRHVTDPRGGVAVVAADRPFALDLVAAGAYTIDAGNTSRRLWANFSDPAESDIGRPPDPAQPPLPIARGPSRAAPRAEFGHALLAVGVALLLLEWIVGSREGR